MRHAKIYISGPISRIPGGNEAEFKRVSDLVAKEGYIPVNPHIIGERVSQNPFWETLTPEERWWAYMEVCIHHVPQCSKIIMLRGWRRSRGAQVEYHLARGRGLKVIQLGGFLGGFFR